MKKATLSLTTLAALTVTTVALADEPNRKEGPTSTLARPTAAPMQAAGWSPQPGGQQPGAPQPGAPQPGAQLPVPAPSTPAPACPPTSVTTITSADMPPMMAPPPARETITVRQSYRPHRPLLYTGGSMLVGSYAATAAMTAVRDVRDANGDQMLYIPVAGPWLHLSTTAEKPLDTALIAGSGVAQGVGTLLSMLSLVVPEKIPAATIEAGGVKVLITATAPGRGAAGIGAIGQF